MVFGGDQIENKEIVSKGIKWCDRIIYTGLIIFVFFLPLTLSGAEIGYSIAFSGWISKMLFSRKIKLSATPLDLPFIFFWIITAITIIFAVNPMMSMGRLNKIPLFFMPYLIVENIRDEKKIIQLIQVLLFSTTIIAGVGIYGYFFKGMDRISSIIGNHCILEINTLGEFLSMVLPFAFVFLIYRGSLWTKIVDGFMSMIIMIAIVLTYSRGAYLGFLGIVILGFFIVETRKIALIVLLAVSSLALLFYAVSPRITRQFKDRIDMKIGVSGGERLYKWQTGWQIFKDYPLTGVGVDCIETIYPKYMNPKAIEKMGNLHNNFVQEAVEKGIGGLIVFIWICVAFLYTGINAYKKNKTNILKGITFGCLASYIAFMVSGFFHTNLFIPLILRLWLFIVGVCLTMNKLAETQVE